MLLCSHEFHRTYILLFNRRRRCQIQRPVWSTFGISLWNNPPILRLAQENLLYIFDPKALQHIIVKVSSVLKVSYDQRTEFVTGSTYFSTVLRIYRVCPHFLTDTCVLTDLNAEPLVFCWVMAFSERSASTPYYYLFNVNWPPIVDEQHRKQRKMLKPAFSIKHMREMGELISSTVLKWSNIAST